ncbi:sepiapterin reductase (L-erythro-7,8-dihydrobiopterin forming) [Synchytrium microbalum]|uniref:Sepiapterin reductase n=1 Tax=Synchytrium microbalum TaxID=1806994 RepID=A0A507C175_9FUNG|nr:sepiapterin reductase (L-erythro-7,8-dihydrobiopterin forming) [Synchytrium microbalum]TPX31814.1 sepiapterin reductase (L-erythro-7,8-dihydrobiopterin forming) [Synchytrium microbalum]
MGGNTLVFITGASKGFGRAIIVALIDVFDDAEYILISRDDEGLKASKSLIGSKRPNAVVSTYSIDLSDLKSLEGGLDGVFKNLSTSTLTCTYLFNNAGSLGPLTRAEKLCSPSSSLRDIQSAIDLNVTSTISLTARFLATFQTCEKVRVVNVSSLAALQSFDSWSVYCAGKAARDMFFATVAHEAEIREGKDSKRLKTLNYAPGPMDTDMQQAIREDMNDVPLRKTFDEMHSKGELVDPVASASAMVDLLVADQYVNGSHVDYYDIR